MKGLILAAGYATRLYPLTENQPKPLLPLAGRPIIEHIITKFEELDMLDEIFVVTNHKFYQHFSSWQEKSSKKIKITVYDDGTLSNDDRLGAIGDIYATIQEFKVDDDLFIIAGDNYFKEDLSGIIANFKNFPDAVHIGLYELGSLENAHRYGVCTVNDKKQVIEFQEKPKNPKSSLISMGMYIYPKEKLKLIHKYMNSGEKSDAPGNLVAWLVKNDKVLGYAFTGQWFDIGDIESYHAADKSLT